MLLLDTHALLWLDAGAPMSEESMQAIERAAQQGVRLTPLTPAIAIESSFLPATFHGDPADRLLVATARALPATVVTRDRAILAYAAAGHVQALVC